MDTIKIPYYFWQDCVDACCDVPDAVKQTKSHVWILKDDERITELVSRAHLYADHRNGYWEESRGLVFSARATIKAIQGAAS